ncbi:SprT-like domain-containing protein [Aphelenchoides besseyi]|nr:SprT-like domain-containing protein [Aphelenchoides besseyi]KAI6199392.1 SprT-like domain-containing protein [Aphelenchoides besseyi]
MGDFSSSGSFVSSDNSESLNDTSQLVDHSAIEATESEEESSEPIDVCEISKIDETNKSFDRVEGSVTNDSDLLSDDNDENNSVLLQMSKLAINESLDESGSIDVDQSSNPLEKPICLACNKNETKPKKLVNRVVLDDSDFANETPPCICFNEQEDDLSEDLSFVVSDDHFSYESLEEEEEEEEEVSEETELTDVTETESEDESDEFYESSFDESISINEENDDIRKVVELKTAKLTPQNRQLMANKVYELLNEIVFDGQLPSDMNVEWNKRLLKTAGRFHHSDKCIELSVKVLTTSDRLMNTLLHEQCHAAVSLIDNVRAKRSHGAEFKQWGHRAHVKLNGHLTVDTYHNYDIDYKYRFVCTGCQMVVKRHSKSIDVNKVRCRNCHGVFEMTVNGQNTH